MCAVGVACCGWGTHIRECFYCPHVLRLLVLRHSHCLVPCCTCWPSTPTHCYPYLGQLGALFLERCSGWVPVMSDVYHTWSVCVLVTHAHSCSHPWTRRGWCLHCLMLHARNPWDSHGNGFLHCVQGLLKQALCWDKYSTCTLYSDSTTRKGWGGGGGGRCWNGRVV